VIRMFSMSLLWHITLCNMQNVFCNIGLGGLMNNMIMQLFFLIRIIRTKGYSIKSMYGGWMPMLEHGGSIFGTGGL